MEGNAMVREAKDQLQLKIPLIREQGNKKGSKKSFCKYISSKGRLGICGSAAKWGRGLVTQDIEKSEVPKSSFNL